MQLILIVEKGNNNKREADRSEIIVWGGFKGPSNIFGIQIVSYS